MIDITSCPNAVSALDQLSRLQAMTRRYIGTQESERRALARELHDRVSSNLAAIGLNIGLLERQLGEQITAPVRGRLADTIILIKDTLGSCRDISFNLHPAGLDYAGVLLALEDYGREYRARTGISVEVSGTSDELRLTPEREIALYRIAQEALTNCAKHAHARTVKIELTCDDERVLLTISDDGAGFDLNGFRSGGTSASAGLGILAMSECAEAIGGTFQIESLPEQGTRIVVDLQQGLSVEN